MRGNHFDLLVHNDLWQRFLEQSKNQYGPGKSYEISISLENYLKQFKNDQTDIGNKIPLPSVKQGPTFV